MDLKEKTGASAGPFTFTVTSERMELFAKALHAPARDHAHPMFLTIFREGEFALLERLAIPLSRILHGEQEYEFASDIKDDDRVVYATSLTRVLEKSGGQPMVFLTFETEITAGRPIARSKSLFIYRPERMSEVKA